MVLCISPVFIVLYTLRAYVLIDGDSHIFSLLIYRNVLCMSQCDLMFLSAILAKLNFLKLKKHSRTPLVKISRDLKLVGKKMTEVYN